VLALSRMNSRGPGGSRLIWKSPATTGEPTNMAASTSKTDARRVWVILTMAVVLIDHRHVR
jgi:hypothetical protein